MRQQYEKHAISYSEDTSTKNLSVDLSALSVSFIPKHLHFGVSTDGFRHRAIAGECNRRALIHITSIRQHNEKTLEDFRLFAQNIDVSPREPPLAHNAGVVANQIEAQLTAQKMKFPIKEFFSKCERRDP